MNIAICDDEEGHINSLEKSLFKIAGGRGVKIECDAYHSGEKLIAAYRHGAEKYDVIFMDMEMASLSGIETANAIRENDEYVIIVFVTSHTEYMRESFVCSPFRFLVKPVDESELETVFSDICKKLSKKKKVLTLTENKAIVRLKCEDIICCESRDHTVYIYTADGEYKIYKTLSDLYSELDGEFLFRVHSSFIVNFHYVKAIRGDEIELYRCGKKIPVSRSYKKAVLAQFTDFVERNLYI